jgi:hypothetical protein
MTEWQWKKESSSVSSCTMHTGYAHTTGVAVTDVIRRVGRTTKRSDKKNGARRGRWTRQAIRNRTPDDGKDQGTSRDGADRKREQEQGTTHRRARGQGNRAEVEKTGDKNKKQGKQTIGPANKTKKD